MYLLRYPTYDTTIYEKVETRNTGIDQILEITKNVPNIKDPEDGYVWPGIYNSRILMKFDISEISDRISDGTIPLYAQYYLNLKGTRSVNLPISYSLEIHAVSQSWDNGRGHYNDFPPITTGVSWKYRNGYYSGNGNLWTSGSLVAGTTASYSSTAGGGTWYTGSQYYASQSFNYSNEPDIRVDISNIVREWISGSIENNGIIIKKPTSIENSIEYTGNIRFFSRDTHTVFMPKLEISWDDSDLSGTGSFSEVGDSYVIGLTNIKKEYRAISKEKFRLRVRDRYPALTYATSSNYLQSKILPTSSYYAIQDTQNDSYIIPFDNNATKLSVDSQGNYFVLDMDNFLPDRFYKIVFKVVRNGSSTQDIIDKGYYFKVVK